MRSLEIRQSFLDFFKEKGHAVVPSTSLLPADPTVLFTTAGMQQFKEYYLGKPSPYGKRAASCQKCFRTSDIEEVGDESHLTFLEMLGNFSFGDYFKKEAIEWAYKLLTAIYKLPATNLWITYFQGDRDVPEDKESQRIWENVGIPKKRIHGFSRKDNFWGPTGKEGPCGPTTEIHYDLTRRPCQKGKNCIPNCECGRFVELWNLVFNEYYQDQEKKLSILKEKGVDTGMGLERLVMVLQKKQSVFETDLFWPVIEEIKNNTSKPYSLNKRPYRIIADHIKGSVFLASESVLPSNTEQGYILRRILRRAIRYGKLLNFPENLLISLAQKIIEIYKNIYPELRSQGADILTIIQNEKEKFEKSLNEGIKISQKILTEKNPIKEKLFYKIMNFASKQEIFRQIYREKSLEKYRKEFSDLGINITWEDFKKATITGKEAFDLYQSYGFPIEMIIELVQEKHLFVDIESFEEELRKHQEISRAGAERKFGGVGISKYEVRITKSPEEIAKITKLHTATHLLQAALIEILGKHVQQMGSDITIERLRFDFTHPQKMTKEEIQRVEDLVNKKIKENLEVTKKEMSYPVAIQSGALAFFKEKYPERVTVYSVGDFSKEICGGPHVKNTSELKHFIIKKEESCGAGIRRIKAIIE